MPPSDAPNLRPCDGEDEAEQPRRDETRPGLPDESTVVAETTFVSPKGRRYRILKTRQKDPYDPPREGEE